MSLSEEYGVEAVSGENDLDFFNAARFYRLAMRACKSQYGKARYLKSAKRCEKIAEKEKA